MYDWLIIIGLNLLLALIVIFRYRSDRPKAICYGLIIICIPLFGLLFLVSHRLAKKIFKMQEYIEEKPEKGRQLFSDFQTAADEVVPLNDALAIESFAGKRKLLTNVIKEDSLTNQHILKRAIGDTDREISHYAAAMLTDRIARLERRLYEDKDTAPQPGQSVQRLIDRLEAFSDYLALNYLDEKSHQQKETEYSSLLAELLDSWQEDEKYFADKINIDIKRADFASAEKYLAIYKEKFPKNEAVYLLAVKLYQKQHNREMVQQSIEELKACPINLSAEGLRIIRFWGGK